MPQFRTFQAREGLATDGPPSVPVSGAVGAAVEGFGGQIGEIAAHMAKRDDQKRRFDAEIGLDRLIAEQEREDIDAARQAPADGSGWTDGRSESFGKRVQAYVGGLDPSIRDEYGARAGVLATRYRTKAADFEVSRRETWALGEIGVAAEGLKSAVYASPGELAAARGRYNEIVMRAPVTEARRAELLRDGAAMFDEAAAMGAVDVGDYDGALRIAAGGSYEDRLISQESGGDPSARAGTSSATGLAQFTDSTWRAVVNSSAGRAAGLTLDGRTDPEQARAGLRIFTGWNRNDLVKAGFEPTEKNLYIAHFLGAAGATKFLGALRDDPTQSAAELLPDAAAANKRVFYRRDGTARSVEEVYRNHTRRFTGETPVTEAPAGGGMPWEQRHALSERITRLVEAKRAEDFALHMAGAPDYASYLAAGNQPVPELEAKYAPERILSFGTDSGPDAAAAMSEARQMGAAMRDVQNAGTSEDRYALLAREEAAAKAAGPDGFQANAKRLQAMRESVARIEKELADDPGSVAMRAESVRRAASAFSDGKGSGEALVASMIAEQERLGVPDERIVALPKDAAASMAARLEQLPPEQKSQELQAMRQTYGALWPKVWREVGAKLPGPLAVAAAMPPGRDATMLVAMAGLKADELTAGLASDAKSEVENKLRDNDTMQMLGRSLSSDRSGAAVTAQYYEAAKVLALGYMRDGMGAEDAAARAAEAIMSDTAFVEVNDVVARVPSDVDFDTVEAEMNRRIEEFDAGMADPPADAAGLYATDPDGLRATYQDFVRNHGAWVNDAEGKGVYLYDGRALVTRDGKPVLVTWDELARPAQNPEGDAEFNR